MFEKEYALDEVESIARVIVELGRETNVWLFQGDLGAGKTTLLKSIAKIVKVMDEVSSPSFSVVNEYIKSGDKKVYHFDFYRLQDPTELTDLGWWEILEEEELIWIEWPEMIEDYLPEPHLFVHLQHISAEKRHITIKKHG